MFALPKHIADEMAIKRHYTLHKISTNFDKRQFKSNQTKTRKLTTRNFEKSQTFKNAKICHNKNKTHSIDLSNYAKN